ncbi:DMT family transporter [Acuticoccus kandeliae]|uniref:DMT family transporter n=1 Tax=Acuticoccus kandeliae TaxID=2073160 RepID=UPI000D3EC986|nr:DMT family transporter [Acuticoccus kandeliae]
MNIPARWAYLAVFIGVCGHASSEFFAKLTGMAGPEVSVWRYVIGAAGLLLWSLSRPDTRDLLTPLREDWRKLVPLSLVGVSLAYLFFHWSLDFASVIQVATLVTTIPIFVGLANLVINRTPISTVKMITGALAVLGVTTLLTDGTLDVLSAGGSSLWGVLMATLCAALVAIFSVMAKPLMVRHGAMRTTTLAITIGAVGLWVGVGLFWGRWVNPLTLTDRPATAVWSLLVLGLWNTTVTQLMWLGGLAAAPDMTRASYLFFLKPVIAAFLAILFLGDSPTWLQLVAIVVVSGSVLVEITWPRGRPSAKPA